MPGSGPAVASCSAQNNSPKGALRSTRGPSTGWTFFEAIARGVEAGSHRELAIEVSCLKERFLESDVAESPRYAVGGAILSTTREPFGDDKRPNRPMPCSRSMTFRSSPA